MTLDTTPDGRRDFDFYYGSWHITARRLRERLANCTEWEEFEAVGSCRPLLGGMGNLDDFQPLGDDPDLVGFEGLTLRIFNPATRLWSLYWADNVRCALFPPLVGRFDASGTNGEFFGDEEHNGQPVKIRFLWTVIDSDNALWQQAYSADDGATWETNWTMHHHRTAPYVAE